jgi:hypothetical protein
MSVTSISHTVGFLGMLIGVLSTSLSVALAVAASNYFSPNQICKREVKSPLDSEAVSKTIKLLWLSWANKF